MSIGQNIGPMVLQALGVWDLASGPEAGARSFGEILRCVQDDEGSLFEARPCYALRQTVS